MFAACTGTVVPPPLPVLQPVSRSTPSILSTSATPTVAVPAPAPLLPASQATKTHVMLVETYRETCTAAWYGKEMQGRRTANNELFDPNGLTAAHRTLPLGTSIRVTNLDNHSSVVVHITDRGPFTNNRCLDLSLGAARALDLVARGTTRVRLESLDTVRSSLPFTVQAALYVDEESARMLKWRLSKKYEIVSIVSFETNAAKYYAVRVGSYASEEKADLIAGKLALDGLEPVILRKDN